MEEDTLYEEDKLKITYLHNPNPGKENEIESREDHELWLKEGGEWQRYIIQRGILRELERAARQNASELLSMLNNVNTHIYPGMSKAGVNLKDVAEAIVGACEQEDNAFEAFCAEHKI
jgi:hypothetical protein